MMTTDMRGKKEEKYEKNGGKRRRKGEKRMKEMDDNGRKGEINSGLQETDLAMKKLRLL